MARWNKKKVLGRVVLRDHKGNPNASPAAPLRARARKLALGLPDRKESPVSNWRVSRYRAKGIRKPKHPRVRLRETVAREAREIQDFARKHSMAAIQLAAQIMADPHAPESARLQAMDLVLNRAYGKPNQTNTNLNVDANGKPREVSTTELDRRIEEALGAVEDLTRRTVQKTKGKEQPADVRERNRNPDGSEPQLH